MKATLAMLNLLRGGTKTIAGRQVHPNPGTITGQSVLLPSRRKPLWLTPAEWRTIGGDEEAIRWGGDQDYPELVVRRADRHTARITDLDGDPYSELMRIEDAIQLLNQTKGTK